MGAVRGTAPELDPPCHRRPAWTSVAFAAAAIACFATLVHLGRDLLFFVDEWIWIIDRRRFSVDALLEPHVGHLSVIPVAIYQTMFRVFGIEDYTPYRVLIAGLHVAAITLVFVYLRRRVSERAALIAATVLLFFGAAWQDLLWAFQIGFVLSVAAGVAAFLLLDADRPGSDRLAAVCALVALGSSSIGLPLAFGLAVELALRRDGRRWWVVGGPFLLYGAWYAGFGESIGTVRGRFPGAGDPALVDVVRYAVETAGATVGAMTGVGSSAGQILLVPLAVGVGLTAARVTRERRARILALAAVPITFSVSVGVSRLGIQPPGESRYLYASAVFIVLLLAECVRGRQITLVALVGLLAVGAWSVAWNVDELLDGRDQLHRFARRTSVELGAVLVGTRGVDAEYAAQRPRLPRLVRQYVAAFDELGFPGEGPAEIAVERESDRQRADAVLVHATGVHLTGTGTSGSTAAIFTNGRSGITYVESCILVGSTDAELAVTGVAVVIVAVDGPVEVRLRYFADGYFSGTDAWATVHSHESRRLRLPGILAGPWTVGIHTAGRALVCSEAARPK